MGLTRLNSKMIEVPAEIESLQTDTITTDTITSIEGIFTSLTAQNVLFGTTDYLVETVNETKTFTNDDNTKAFHFNTIGIDISAIFPSSLEVGFNVSIYNTSTGFIYLSSVNPIQATGQFNNTPFTGMFIYKHSDGLFYGVGVFE